MLLELRIENLLLIERAALRLGEGLNAITGETGAGKTVLAHSLDLLLGGKARSQIVRPGAAEAWVEGTFSLPEGLLDDPDLAELRERLPEGAEEVTLGRRIGASGRTSAFVAGRSASAADLRNLGSRLVAFYGQHEHRRLMLGSAQLEVLDGFAGSEHLDVRASYRAAHAEVARLAAELERLRDREGTRERDLDLLRFELAEIEASAPDPGEEAELAADRERLRHAEVLRSASAAALAALSGSDDGVGGARSLLGEAEAALAGAAGVDGELDALGERASSLALELDDLAGALRSYGEGIDSDPGRLEELEERLAALDRLKRKHGGSVESVLAHAERCRAEIERLENAGEVAAGLEDAFAAAEARRAELAKRLTAGRRDAADALAERVAAELDELAMDGARLEVALGPHPDGFGPSGAEAVEFELATNPGMPIAPLREAASGGELSRVMLALAGLDGGQDARTLVFDEIDAGIGGTTARAVGERLRALAEGRQLICITHLPQVASQAGTHFRIAKRAAGGATVATVERVGGDELVAEIVRMLGAERGDEVASRHARELLKAA
ncbi:MAG TPA: DNA repair protein RecN [Solirubrobacterales bacterium]|nr:DNA repair protein RecN [Solirubrobacterales bacterium]